MYTKSQDSLRHNPSLAFRHASASIYHKPMVRQRMREAGVKGEGMGDGGWGVSINPENNLRHTQSLPFPHPSAVEEGCRKGMLIVRMRDRRLWGRNGEGVSTSHSKPRFPVS